MRLHLLHGALQRGSHFGRGEVTAAHTRRIEHLLRWGRSRSSTCLSSRARKPSGTSLATAVAPSASATGRRRRRAIPAAAGGRAAARRTAHCHRCAGTAGPQFGDPAVALAQALCHIRLYLLLRQEFESQLLTQPVRHEFLHGLPQGMPTSDHLGWPVGARVPGAAGALGDAPDRPASPPSRVSLHCRSSSTSTTTVSRVTTVRASANSRSMRSVRIPCTWR